MTVVALTCIFAVALVLRVLPPWPNVFGGPFVNFQGNDCWYHMRLVDNLLANFPVPLTFDPYFHAHRGGPVPVAPMVDLIIATVAWIAGLGAPSPRTVDLAGAWVPALMGALVVIPIYVIGARAGARPIDRKVGLLAAGLVAVTPGPFLERTMLGSADHHVGEVLFAAITLALLVLASQATRPGRRAMSLSLGAGLALAAYLLTWSSGAFLVAILVAWYVVQLAIDHLQGRSDDHAARVLAPALGLALPLLLALRPWATYRGGVHLMALGGGLCICLALEGGRRLWLRRRWPVRAFPLAMAAVACLVPLVLLAAFPVVRTTVLTDLRRFSPDAIASTITEIRPLFMQPGAFAWRPVWETLGAAAILGPLGLVALAWLARREGRAAQGLVLVTTAVFLLATLAQNRFSYYLAMMLAVPVAVLGGLALDWALAAGRRAPLAETGGRAAKTDKATRPTATGGRRKSVPKRRGGPGGAHGRVAVAAVVLAGTAIAANLSLAVDRARRNQGLDGRWHAALSWLRQASPEPFGDPGVYVAPTAPPGRWPRPAHSVMAWWDYGYEIMRVARRAPVANPTQTGARDAALFFTETDERAALERLASFRVSHVIADMLSTFQPMGSISKWGGRFDSVIAWAGHPKDRYMSSYRARNPAGQLETLHVLHPDYYRSMAVRLFVLGGRAAIPRNSSWVVSYVDRPDGDAGKPVREVTGLRHFATYEEAVAYLLSQPRGTAEIVGLDPINPPIPIDALSSFKEVHTAPGKPPLLRVFEVATK